MIFLLTRYFGNGIRLKPLAITFFPPVNKSRQKWHALLTAKNSVPLRSYMLPEAYDLRFWISVLVRILGLHCYRSEQPVLLGRSCYKAAVTLYSGNTIVRLRLHRRCLSFSISKSSKQFLTDGLGARTHCGGREFPTSSGGLVKVAGNSAFSLFAWQKVFKVRPTLCRVYFSLFPWKNNW